MTPMMFIKNFQEANYNNTQPVSNTQKELHKNRSLQVFGYKKSNKIEQTNVQIIHSFTKKTLMSDVKKNLKENLICSNSKGKKRKSF